MHLQSVVRQFELCYRLSNLDASEHACFHHSIKKCRGACIGAETPDEYNERVEQAMLVLNKRLSGSYLIIDQGRTDAEKAVIGVQNGAYIGYGFVDQNDGFASVEDLLEALSPPLVHDPEVARIIRVYLDGQKAVKVIKY